MTAYKLTNKAKADLTEILLYTTDTWGKEQAVRYLELLSDGFDLMAEKPGIGRACDSLAAGLRRFELGRHVVFYRVSRGSVVISRILHQRRLPSRLKLIDTIDT